MVDKKISELDTKSPVADGDYVAIVDISATGGFKTKKATHLDFRGPTGPTGPTGGIGSTGSIGPTGPTGVENLSDLLDVSLTGLANNNLLQYDSGSGKWKNKRTLEYDADFGTYLITEN